MKEKSLLLDSSLKMAAPSSVMVVIEQIKEEPDASEASAKILRGAPLVPD
jgi:hypothetical protein